MSQAPASNQLHDPNCPPTPRLMMRRALRLLCPQCGQGEVFLDHFRLRERCPRCRIRFEREQGYFVGAMYVNFFVTCVAVLPAVFLLQALGIPLWANIVAALVLCAAIAGWFFPYSKLLWLSFDLRLSPYGGSNHWQGGGGQGCSKNGGK